MAPVKYEFTYEYSKYPAPPSGKLVIPSSVEHEGITYSVVSIGEAAFYKCDSLISVSIPNSVTNIGDIAFADCKDLTSISIPNSVTKIGDGAFSGCSKLKSIEIPNSVTSIGSDVFYNCTELTKPVYNANCFAYFPCGYATEYTISDGIQQIAGSAFYNCNELKHINIPNSVTEIGDYAFYKCRSLESFSIPESVRSIGEGAFYYTGWIENQPDGILYSDGWCLGFLGDMPEKLVIAEGTKYITNQAFAECKELKSVTIPNSEKQ